MALRATWEHIGILAIVCAGAFLWRLGSYGIFDLDEALYVACAREMALTGDLVTPRVNAVPFFEKPPFAYWAAGFFFTVLGRSELTARLPAALATMLLVFGIYAVGRRLFGARAGLLAGLAYALSPLVLGSARMLTTDALLCLWIGVAQTCALALLLPGRFSALGWKLAMAVGLGVFCGLGVLTKGLPGVVFPIATLVTARAIGRFRPVGRVGRPALSWWAVGAVVMIALAACALVATPWHVLAYRRSGDAFWDEYIVRQHLGRFRGGDLSHTAPFWFFVPVLLVGFFPWSLILIGCLAALRLNADPEDSERTGARQFLWVWAALVFVAFSASGSKLVSYILPMFAPLALLTGDCWSRAMERPASSRALAWATGSACVLAAALCAIPVFHGPIVRAVETSTRRPIVILPEHVVILTRVGWMLALVAIACGAAWRMTRVQRPRAAAGMLLAGMAAFVALAVGGLLPAIDRAFSRDLHEAATAGSRLAQRNHSTLLIDAGSPRRPSALFYVPDSMILASYTREPGVREVGGKGTQARMGRYSAQRSDVILADAKRGAALSASGTAQVTARYGAWLVLVVARDGLTAVPVAR